MLQHVVAINFSKCSNLEFGQSSHPRHSAMGVTSCRWFHQSTVLSNKRYDENITYLYVCDQEYIIFIWGYYVLLVWPTEYLRTYRPTYRVQLFLLIYRDIFDHYQQHQLASTNSNHPPKKKKRDMILWEIYHTEINKSSYYYSTRVTSLMSELDIIA